MAPCVQPLAEGVRLFVRVSPRASRDRIEGVERDAAGQERLRVRVTAPPTEGEANRRVIELLAKAIGIAKSSVAVRQGAHDRNKCFDIAGDTKQLMASVRTLTGEKI